MLPPRRRALVSGVVVDGVGRPLAGVLLGISSGDHPYPEIGVVSGYDGTFELPPLIPGRYVISAYSTRGSAKVAIEARADAPNHLTMVIA
ncbi:MULTISPECIES: hypothetical protein [Sorangium]|uniref:Carboxypeptidase regulatory-like domain-containing protein n=1 Tax=Sorangium cellulosum (strain So ce56) TaxID=448385 RepID=A9FWK7_SORC5|nr:hypothetical protein [Sorangium cellulosum]CAN92389.1 hypothetical protein predicted by Glimmer/Critica [Sorangium cellulosum So ce56]